MEKTENVLEYMYYIIRYSKIPCYLTWVLNYLSVLKKARTHLDSVTRKSIGLHMDKITIAIQRWTPGQILDCQSI